MQALAKYAKWPQYAGIYFVGKGVVFLGLVAAGATALPPMILAGLSVTWLIFGVMLLSIARRLSQLASTGAQTVVPSKSPPLPIRTEWQEAA